MDHVLSCRCLCVGILITTLLVSSQKPWSYDSNFCSQHLFQTKNVNSLFEVILCTLLSCKSPLRALYGSHLNVWYMEVCRHTTY